MDRELIGVVTKPQALKGQFRIKPQLNNLKNYKKLKDATTPNGGEVIEKLYDRIVGRFANKKIINPETKAVICEKLDLITESIAERIVAAGIKEVEIRTTLFSLEYLQALSSKFVIIC